MHAFARLFRQVSLRTKLVALMAALMMCGVGATAMAASAALNGTLLKQIDDELGTSGESVSTLMWAAMNEQLTNDPQTALAWDNIASLRFHGSMRDSEGKVLYELPRILSEQGDAPALPEFPVGEVRSEAGIPFSVRGTAADSAGWRVSQRAMKNDGGYITVALPLDAVRNTVSQATSTMLLTGVLTTLVMSLIAYGVTSRAFRPLVRVERTAAAIAAGDLSRRVEDFPPETEVGRLSRSLNAMLAHIEHAFRGRAASERKMRRFIQDASHELRTPLVTIQGYSELYRHGGLSDPEQLTTAMGRIEGEAKRMAQLVDDLLTLARLDEHRPLERRPVDLLLLATDAVEDARVSAPERDVRLVGLDGGRPGKAPTSGDEARLRQVVANLMTNALRYTPSGSPLEIAVGALPVIDGRWDAVLEVRDHGPGISEEDASRVFERFYRADSSRQRETGGTGLGLAIVAAIAAQHDGSVRLNETPGGGATLSIHLPLEPLDESSTRGGDA